MLKLKRSLHWIFVPTLFVVLILYSSLASAQSKDKITLTIITLGTGLFAEPFKGGIPLFEKEHPNITVNHVTAGVGAADQKVLIGLAAGDATYDVLQIDYVYFKGIMEAGHLIALDDYISKPFIEDLKKDTPENIWNITVQKNKVYGLMTIGNSTMYCYNGDALKKEKIPFPDTWEAILDASKKLTHGGQYGFSSAFYKTVYAPATWMQLFWANGGEIFDAKMRPQLNSPIGVETMELLKELTKYSPPGIVDYKEPDNQRALANGVSILAPCVFGVNAFTTLPPTPELKAAMKGSVVPKGKVKRASVMGGLPLCVSKYSKHKSEAAQFIEWFNTNKAQTELLPKYESQPVRTSAWKAIVNQQPWYKGRMESMAVAVVRPQIPEYNAFDTILGTQVGFAIMGSKTPKQAMDDANSEFSDLLKKAGYYK